jgi:hypothetical protein
VTAKGEFAVSSSKDKTLKVWELGMRRESALMTPSMKANSASKK